MHIKNIIYTDVCNSKSLRAMPKEQLEKCQQDNLRHCKALHIWWKVTQLPNGNILETPTIYSNGMYQTAKGTMEVTPLTKFSLV